MNGQKIPLLKVKQWLNSWEQSIWSPDEGLPKPPQNFYIASMPLKLLRNLAGVSRRQIEERKKVEKGAGYQRAHQASRSRSIARYIQFGYPLSNQTGLEPNEHSKLIHPGWLPMSILVNIIKPGETRRRSGKEVTLESDEAVTISESNGFSFLEIPSSLDSTAAGSKKVLLSLSRLLMDSIDFLQLTSLPAKSWMKTMKSLLYFSTASQSLGKHIYFG